MTLRRTVAVCAVLAALWAPAAQAHRMWMVPSSTVLSGDDPWVTVDGAISNTLFFPDHVPMNLAGVSVIGPDGQVSKPLNPATGKYRSTFDVQLAAPGTYKIVNAVDMMSASYKLGTETKRWRGSRPELATAIPAGATDVKITQNLRRTETFVTRGAPTLTALKPTGKGLELEAITHPNDLVASEKARFRFLLDGKPAANLEIEMAPGAARYRDNPGDTKLTTGADGVAEFTWPAAGMYWIEASVRGGQGDVPGAERNAGYTATFEVLPD